MNISLPIRILDRYRWLAFLLPFLVFMLVGSLEPASPKEPGGKAIGLSIPYSAYPWVYAVKIALTVAAVIAVLPGYRAFPLRVSPLAIVVGIVGGAAWIGLWWLDFHHIHPTLSRVGLGWLVGAGERPAYNPFEQLAAHPAWAWGFLAVRFFGLVAVVPVIEEFFLRGFVMRLPVDGDWWQVPFGKVNSLAVVLGTAVPMLAHPAELLAAAVWFSLITWLMVRTRNIWDCVAAHALTNLVMGLYVVIMGGEAWHMM